VKNGIMKRLITVVTKFSRSSCSRKARSELTRQKQQKKSREWNERKRFLGGIDFVPYYEARSFRLPFTLIEEILTSLTSIF
jgi:hypothetical protein